jgi:hypothetical protein
MTNRIAFVLAAILAVLIAADAWANGGAALLFLARKLFALTDYIAFWR